MVFCFKYKKYSSNYCKPSRRKAILSVTSFLVFFKYWFFIEDKNGIRYFGKEKVLSSIQDVSIAIQDLDEIFLKTVLY